MGAHRDKVLKLTPDPGVLYLADVADEMAAQLEALAAQVDACCHADLSATARTTPTDTPKTPKE